MVDQEVKMEITDGSTDESPKPNENQATEKKALTNIHYDCLERILEFLDAESLSNLADTCKRLQIAAAHFFGEKFGKIVINLTGFRRGAILRDGYIFSGHLKHSLALLRCFGSKITCLTITTREPIHFLTEYIIRYCGDALTQISFNECLPTFSAIENCQQPFKNVERVEIGELVLKDQLAGIAHWFPFMRILTLNEIMFGADFGGVSLPHLDTLDISIIEENGLMTLLHANPQLKYLYYLPTTKMALSKLLEIISGALLISILLVSASGEYRDSGLMEVRTESVAELKRFANEHPSIIILALLEYTFTTDDVIAFVQQLDSMRMFIFNIIGQSEYDRLVKQLDRKWEVELLSTRSLVHFIKLTC